MARNKSPLAISSQRSFDNLGNMTPVDIMKSMIGEEGELSEGVASATSNAVASMGNVLGTAEKMKAVIAQPVTGPETEAGTIIVDSSNGLNEAVKSMNEAASKLQENQAVELKGSSEVLVKVDLGPLGIRELKMALLADNGNIQFKTQEA